MSDFDLLQCAIPIELKDITLPTPEEVGYWAARKNRTFYIDYDIEDRCELNELSKVLIQMNVSEKDIPADELKPIYLYVFSYGGNLDDAQAFCDIVEASRIPIVTIGMGACMSAGFLIFLAGKRRYAFKHCQFMAHSGSAAFQGTAEQIQQAQDNYKKQIMSMKDYILSHTLIDEKTFNKNKTKDWYLINDDIEKYGVAKVITSFEDIV